MGHHDPEHWYSPEDLPDGRLHVRVWWMAHGIPRKLDAARVWSASEGALQWYTIDVRSNIVMIPPRGLSGDAWGDEPECWQPLASAWTWPDGHEPYPLPAHAVPRIIELGRQRYSEVEAAEAEQAGYADVPVDDDDMPWWRDATQIRYERPGEVTMRMAEGRMMRALAHCGALNPRLYAATTGTLLAALADHANVEARAAAAYLARFQPLPQDAGDFLTAMAWFAALNPPVSRGPRWRPWSLNRRQRVMHYRSMDRLISYADIGHEISSADRKRMGNPVSWQFARQLYIEGIEAVHRIANRAHPAANMGVMK